MQKSLFRPAVEAERQHDVFGMRQPRRLREAERRLLFTDASNAQICKACGFSDSKYFYRNFQQEFQMTPGQWKSLWTQGPLSG